MQKLKNPTRYHVLQSQKRQMREYVSHKHYFLGPPKTAFQPHSAPETVPGGHEAVTEAESTGLTCSNNTNNQQTYFCSNSAPEHAQISTKETKAAGLETEVSSLGLGGCSKASKSKCESPERINFNTDNASGAIASSASKVRPLHRS